MSKATLATSVSCLVILLLATTSGIGSHEERYDERIVHPYGLQVITHIPVVAGYEPYPTPMHCEAGAPGLSSVAYAEDFEGAHGWGFHHTSLAPTSTNVWHVTDFEGAGEASPGKRLYFGYSAGATAGTYEDGNDHPAGSARSPAITLPAAGEAVLTLTTKWQTEYLAGYDHMWVELVDDDGQIHLLCSNNAAGRVDGMGVFGDSLYSSCSPFLYSPCPASNGDYLPPFDVGYPHWETRWIEIPETLMGKTVQIQLTFDAADGASNWWLGWMVHDVAIGTV